MKHEHEDHEAKSPVPDTNGNRSLSTGLSAFSVSSSCTESGVPVVAPAGEVDFNTVTQLDREIACAARSASPWLIIDFTAATFIDSTVVHLLDAVSRGYEGAGRKLTVVAPDQSIRKVFEITGIDRTLTVVDALGDATHDEPHSRRHNILAF